MRAAVIMLIVVMITVVLLHGVLSPDVDPRKFYTISYNVTGGDYSGLIPVSTDDTVVIRASPGSIISIEFNLDKSSFPCIDDDKHSVSDCISYEGDIGDWSPGIADEPVIIPLKLSDNVYYYDIIALLQVPEFNSLKKTNYTATFYLNTEDMGITDRLNLVFEVKAVDIRIGPVEEEGLNVFGEFSSRYMGIAGKG